MNIFSPCSGDFAFTEHPCFGSLENGSLEDGSLEDGSLEDVTKGHLSLTHSSYSILFMHMHN